jgi:hypothetical protein
MRLSRPLFLAVAVALTLARALPAQDLTANEREQAKAQLDKLARYLVTQSTGIVAQKGPYEDVDTLLKSLKRFPEGHALRLQAIGLARQYANPEALIHQGPGERRSPHLDYHQHAQFRLHFAWRVLLETGVLRPGMKLEEAVAILGMPSPTRSGMEWHYRSGMHVNPALRCRVNGGRVETIEITRS